MRIIAGIWRGRPLKAPATNDISVRPTSDRVRESLFSILHSRLHGDWALHVVGDFCAGTGALGLEALSRGAAFAYFIERDRAAKLLIEENVKSLGAIQRASVVLADATRLTPHSNAPCTLVFLDPPYGAGVCEISTLILKRAAEFGWLADRCLASIEAPAQDVIVVDGWTQVDQRQYGKTALHFLQRD